MTENEKIMIAGCAAGAAAATVPAVYGYIKATAAAKPIAETDFLHTENAAFVNENGISTSLRGINLNDDIFFFSKADIESPKGYDVFYALEKRFGNYGARQLVQKYYENFISPSDIKFIKKLGANCVRIPLRYRYLCRKDSCKDDIDFEKLDFLVEKCRKAGLYVIFELHSAPGFQNTDSACGSGDESILFNSGKEGFEARNATIRFWTQVASHYKDEPTVAAYDLLNRPLNRIADWESKTEVLNKFCRRLCKAIRTVDERHIIITEAAGTPDTLPSKNDLPNIAYGFYSHFRTTFETAALIKNARYYKNNGIPCIVCKIRAEENLASSLTALNDCGISWLVGDYKGSGLKSAFLFGGSAPDADLSLDSYEEIGKKWSKPLATKNFSENEEMSAILKDAFKYGEMLVLPEGKSKKNKPKIKVKIGAKLIVGK
ncbi:MAG: cellulase family glycosylhydrolase [Clostridia bacterium]|nr:cellulase family glycosylhydrolase [Clostridia bacterium]